MSWTIIITLLLVGLLIFLLEIFVIPGAGIAGVIGAGLMIAGVYYVYRDHGSTAGHIVVGVTMFTSCLLLYWSFKSNTWDKLMLKEKLEGKVNTFNEEAGVMVGDIGESSSRLAPSGKARFDGKYFEVHTNGEFVDEKSSVVVSKIKSNKIYVKLLNN